MAALVPAASDRRDAAPAARSAGNGGRKMSTGLHYSLEGATSEGGDRAIGLSRRFAKKEKPKRSAVTNWA